MDSNEPVTGWEDEREYGMHFVGQEKCAQVYDRLWSTTFGVVPRYLYITLDV
jgi:hypothetical protein